VIADRRLDIALDALRFVLTAYLVQLRQVWATSSRDGNVSDVERVIASIGARAQPSSAEIAAFGALVAEARDCHHGSLAAIVRALKLSVGEELLVAAAWWADADPQFGVALGCAHDDGNRRQCTAALLRLLLAPFGVDAPLALNSTEVARCGVIEEGPDSNAPIRLSQTARAILSGAPVFAARSGALPARFRETAAALARYLATDGGLVVLRGPAGVGRHAVASAAVSALGLTPVGFDRPAAELRLLARLDLAVPVVPVAELERLGWRTTDGPAIAIAGRDEHTFPPSAYVIELAGPDHAARVRHWAVALSGRGLPDADTHGLLPVIAARFTFTEGDIDSCVARAERDCAWSGRRFDVASLWEAARRQPEHALERVAKLIKPTFAMEDLVLPIDTRCQLQELIAHVALQHEVLDGWGFRRRLPRGQGVAVLFSGPPGTGKTMAAEAIARELGQDLFVADLALIVSKFIGETSKNLAAAFDEAERAGAVLFFDEADALFSKRTEVRDSNDSYRNLDVNYLLQRIESFTGLAILATNKHASIDEAFLRRLRFIIRFELPDSALRRELWKRSFPDGARRDDLDWSELAEADLAGGTIQAAALSAAYLAASDGGKIKKRHLEHSLRREYQKLGRAWPGLMRGTP
jgi:hypothetical protein